MIGAWRWLADMDMGLAIEVGRGEAYAPLGYLNLAFALILAMLMAAVAAVLWSAFIVRRLRREVGEARVVGQYRLEREIGEGGMGKVYLARHALLKRPTALKMLKPHLASDEIVARFEREVQLASQLTASQYHRDLRLRPHARRRLLLRDGVPRGRDARPARGGARAPCRSPARSTS